MRDFHSVGSSFSAIKFIGWGWDGESLILQELQSGAGTGALCTEIHSSALVVFPLRRARGALISVLEPLFDLPGPELRSEASFWMVCVCGLVSPE